MQTRTIALLILAAPLMALLMGFAGGADTVTEPGEDLLQNSVDFEYRIKVLHGDTSVPDEELLKIYGDKVPEDVLMNKYAKKLGGTNFSHKMHVDKKIARCGNCHHENPRDIKPCWECHPEKPEDKKAPKYLKAHHDLCIDCHKALKAEKGLSVEDKPPDKKCYDCHIKKKKPEEG